MRTGGLLAFLRKDKRNRDTFVYLHNNLSRTLFTASHVAQLYRLRWQVELFFKECKSHANLHAFDTGKDEIAEGLIWASLLCAVLKRGLTHLAESCSGVPLSTSRAASSAKHFLDPILRALDSKRLASVLHDASCSSAATHDARTLSAIENAGGSPTSTRPTTPCAGSI